MGQAEGALVEIVVGDHPQAWRSIGFAVGDDGVCQVGATRIRLIGAAEGTARGIAAWALSGVVVPDDGLDGLPTVGVPATPGVDGPGTPPAGHHPNGAVLIDHVVAITPDLDRTTAVIEAAGVAARRTREAGRGRLQRFFRLGEVILELVGPVEPSGDGPAALWGLAFTVTDIDATAALLGERVGVPKPAVQPGRRITSLRADDAVSVPIAFMSGDDRPEQAGAAAGADGGDRSGRSGDPSL
jgi:hypothetical protein